MTGILLKYLFGMIVAAAGFVVIARLIFALPAPETRAATTALPPSSDDPLFKAAAAISADHPGMTGIHPLLSGTDAFAARMLLASQARSSIDIQYYIWRDDLTGILLLDEIRKAAERGVRVRLLLDDNGIAGLDAALADLNAQPNIEVRLFNPFVLRNPKPLNYAFDFFRLNHRMHNKSFTVDNAATVIGGRNIGDEYFDTGPNSIFLDLDVLAIGKVVPDVSSSFDAYWSSPVSYPLQAIVGNKGGGMEALREAVEGYSQTPQYAQYRTALETSGLVTGLLNRSLALEWTSVELVSDDPAKAQGKAKREALMISRLIGLLQRPVRTLDLVSAYFVPGKLGAGQLSALQQSGVRVRILTNSFEATDVALVHSGYAKYRRALLEAGVQLFELKSQGIPHMGREELGPVGSSGSSLHAKTFSADGRHVFVGSFNFDPRSALLNTEMGLMIESPTLARAIAGLFDSRLADISYRLTLSEAGETLWSETAASGAATSHATEPGTTLISRMLVRFAGWLPVEWML